VGKPSFELGEHEMELGLGIHGEPGVERAELQRSIHLTETLLTKILKYGNFGDEKRVALLVNNLGATTEMELAIVARDALSLLEREGIGVERLYAGTFLSSLDMAGVSLSVLGVNDERLRWLDANTTAPAWPNLPKQRPGASVAATVSAPTSSPAGRSAPSETGRKTQRAIEAACQALIAAERELTELDRLTGDGDLGASMERGAKAVEGSIGSYPLDDLPATIKALGHTLRRELGGSSGPLYGVLFLRCGSVLETAGHIGVEQWASAVEQGCRAISELGGAERGDRTMLDALVPFVKALRSRETPIAAVEAAERGVEATAQMKPRQGRSSYLGDRVLGHPDPGAKAVSIWLRAAVEALFVRS
jgi:dihydroxyacetone kinase